MLTLVDVTDKVSAPAVAKSSLCAPQSVHFSEAPTRFISPYSPCPRAANLQFCGNFPGRRLPRQVGQRNVLDRVGTRNALLKASFRPLREGRRPAANSAATGLGGPLLPDGESDDDRKQDGA